MENNEKKILRSKKIFTGTSEKLLDGFVVLEGKRIKAVELQSALQNYKLDEYSFHDYGDCTIMPAFHDAHVHLVIGALVESGGFLRDATSEEDAVSKLCALYANKKDAKWIVGGAWDHFKWPGHKLPTKKSLDAFFPDKPVFLMNKECHGAWVNSKTLEYFGITKDTPDPHFGEIFRDENGEPTGYLLEMASVDVLKKILAEMPKDVLGGYVSEFTKRAYSLGITSVSEMQYCGVISYDVFDMMNTANNLNTRVHFTVPITRTTEEILSLREKYSGERLRFSGVKDFVDGTPLGYTGLMIEPYSDMPNSKGHIAIDIDFLRERVIELDNQGIRIRLHACGDMAVRVCLDCFEAARKKNGNKGTRHTIEHIEVCNPVDVPRFAELDVIASVQADHMPKYDFENHPFHRILGKERMEHIWPFGSLLKSGAMLGFGTDYPVAELTPFRGLYRAVTRMTDEQKPEGGYTPSEKITLFDALRANTYGAAFVNERENDMGTLAPGKYADIAILSNDIFAVEPVEIKNTEVIATIMDGDFVFER